MDTFKYINIYHSPIYSGFLASVYSVRQSQESLCNEMFILESLLEGLEDKAGGSLA